MNPEESIRLECLKYALETNYNGDIDILLENAYRLFFFVIIGSAKKDTPHGEKISD